MAAEGHEALGLDAVPSEQHPCHGRLQVVVLDARRHPTHPGEGVDMAGQERLLGLGGKGPVQGPPRVAQPQREQPQLHHDATDHRNELAEVDLGFGAGLVGLGHRGLAGRGDLCSDAPDVLAHGRLGDVGPVLGDEPGEHPPGGVALLLGHLEVVGQPLAHQGLVGAKDAVATLDRLAWRRDGRRQRVTYRPAVHLVATGQGADRQTFHPVVAPDTFELLHPRHSDLPSSGPSSATTVGGLGSGVGPFQGITVPPSGASSRHHSHVPTLKTEQARIGSAIDTAKDRLADLDANLGEQQEILELAASLATRCGDAYRKSNDRTRKLFNAAVFERLDVKGGQLCHEQYRPPFDGVFTVPEFEYGTRVEAKGIEPTTSCMPCKRSTN